MNRSSLDMVGDKSLIGARNEFEEEGRLNMNKPIYEVGEEVEVRFIGKIAEITKTEKHIFYRVFDSDSGAFATVQEKHITELLKPVDLDDGGIGDIEYERQREEGNNGEEPVDYTIEDRREDR